MRIGGSKRCNLLNFQNAIVVVRCARSVDYAWVSPNRDSLPARQLTNLTIILSIDEHCIRIFVSHTNGRCVSLVLSSSFNNMRWPLPLADWYSYLIVGAAHVSWPFVPGRERAVWCCSVDLADSGVEACGSLSFNVGGKRFWMETAVDASKPGKSNLTCLTRALCCSSLSIDRNDKGN